MKDESRKSTTLAYRPKWMTAFEARNPSSPINENYLRGRNAFNRDLGVIVHSNFFKRLSHKTQVFSLPFNDHVHTRLTHSVEASQIGRQIARYFNMKVIRQLTSGENFYKLANELEELTGAAGLAHDIGHSAFGHKGKKVIEAFCEAKGQSHVFDDNKQVVRILLNELWFEKIKTSGPFVASILKKNPTSANCYPSELASLTSIVNALGLNDLRHPASIFMEAADDIAYLSADVLDFISIYSWEKSFSDTKKFDRFSELYCLDSEGKHTNVSLKIHFDTAIDHSTEENIQNFSDHFLRVSLQHVFDIIDCFSNEFMAGQPSLDAIPEALTRFLEKNAHKFKDQKGRDKEDSNLVYSSASNNTVGSTLFELKDKIYNGAILEEPFIREQDRLATLVLNGILEELFRLTALPDLTGDDMFKKLPSEVQVYLGAARSKCLLFPAIIDVVACMTDRYSIGFWKDVVGLSALDRISARPTKKTG